MTNAVFSWENCEGQSLTLGRKGFICIFAENLIREFMLLTYFEVKYVITPAGSLGGGVKDVPRRRRNLLPGNQRRLQEVKESRQELIQSVTTLKERIVFYFLSAHFTSKYNFLKINFACLFGISFHMNGFGHPSVWFSWLCLSDLVYLLTYYSFSFFFFWC